MQSVIIIISRPTKKRFLEEFFEYLRFPSVSAQPRHKKGPGTLRPLAGGTLPVKSGLERRGGGDERSSHRGGPHAAGKGDRDGPHFVVYGHYDVQPVEPLVLWDSPPFEPRRVGRQIFARGSTDNKGQNFAHLKAVEAYLKTGTPLPCDLTFVIEGEEEVGERQSRHFPQAQPARSGLPGGGDFRYRHAGPETSSLDLFAPGHYGIRNHVARPGAGPALGRFRRGRGKSGHGPGPAACHRARRQRPDHNSGLLKWTGVRPLTTLERRQAALYPLKDSELKKLVGVPQLFGEAGFTPLGTTERAANV